MKIFIDIIFTLTKTIFVFILITLSLTATAKDIKGIIRNKQNQNPIEGVSIQVYSDSLENTALSDMEGFFQATLNPNINSVKIVFAHVSYQPYVITTSVDTLVTIYLHPKDYLLDEVIVKADYITRKDGISIVNMAAIPNVDKFQMDQILKQIPGIIETDKGSYTLNGETVTIYINGVRQNISSSSLHSFLSSLPADAVKSVKLIPINTGQFSSETKAVVDLKINDKIPLGHIFQPTFDFSYRDNEMDNIGTDLFFMTKKGRWLYHNSLSFSNESSKNNSLDSLFMKNLYSTRTNTFQKGRCNVVKYQGSFSYLFNNNNNFIIDAFIYNDFGTTDSKWLNYSTASNEKSKYRNDLYNLALSYSIPSEKKKFNGSVTYSFSYGGRHDNMDFRKSSFESDKYCGKTEMEGWMNNLTATFNTDINNWFLTYGTQLDYNSVWDKSYYDREGLNIGQSVFTGSEWLAALFGQIRYRFSDAFSIMTGARMESTYYRYNHQKQSNVSTSYIDFFPSLMINFDSEIYSGSLGCISQIYRANFSEMLPGLKQINDYIYFRGNPDLKPTNVYAFMLYNTWFGFLQTNFVYYCGKNAMTDKYNMTDNLMVMSKVNASDYNMFRTNIVFPFTFFNDKLTGQLQFNASYKKLYNMRNGFQIPDGRKSGFWKTSYDAVLNYNPIDRLTFMCSLNTVPQTNATLYHSNGFISFGADISYSLLKDKSLTLSCYAYNCFERDKDHNKYFLSNHYFTRQVYRGPQIGISFRWRIKKGQNVAEEYRNYTPSISRF